MRTCSSTTSRAEFATSSSSSSTSPSSSSSDFASLGSPAAISALPKFVASGMSPRQQPAQSHWSFAETPHETARNAAHVCPAHGESHAPGVHGDGGGAGGGRGDGDAAGGGEGVSQHPAQSQPSDILTIEQSRRPRNWPQVEPAHGAAHTSMLGASSSAPSPSSAISLSLPSTSSTYDSPSSSVAAGTGGEGEGGGGEDRRECVLSVVAALP